MEEKKPEEDKKFVDVKTPQFVIHHVQQARKKRKKAEEV